MVIRRGVAVEFTGIAKGGRNEPLKVRVEMEDGRIQDAYLKPSGRPGLCVPGMAAEMLGAMLAGDLGISVNEPLLIEIEGAFIRSVPDVGLRSMLSQSCPLAFASVSAGAQWRDWSIGDHVTPARRAAALQILAFDVMIDNVDRNLDRPNVLIKGDEIRVIDHENAFRFGLLIGQKVEPWKQGYCHRHVCNGTGHVFGPRLKGQMLDFAPLRAAWAALSPQSFMRYSEGIPSEWHEASKTVDDAQKHLVNVHEQFEQCLCEMKRALT